MIGFTLLVLIGVDILLLWLWLARVSGELRYFREEIERSWNALRARLLERQELIPYLLASLDARLREAAEAIGNACDLASSSSGVGAHAQAEARLNDALAKLWTALPPATEPAANRNVQTFRERLRESEERIRVLTEVYNRQVQAYNNKFESVAVRWLGLFVAIPRAEPFLTQGGQQCESQPG
jgi:hypothetical protein